MKVGGITLDAAANRLAWVSTASPRRFRWLTALLRARYNFERAGTEVEGPDEVLYRDFVRGDLRLHAGQDNWAGYYLLAGDAVSDAFLRELYGKHCRG